MGIKLSEKQLEELLNKNPSLKVSQSLGAKDIKNNKLSLSRLEIPQEKKDKIIIDIGNDEGKIKIRKNSDTNSINIMNVESTYEYSYSDTHFSILFHNAKLLSVNQIFAILQSGKYKIFSYKKKWHSIIQKILYEAYIESRRKNETFPFFSENLELTLFRQAKRLVDEDAMTTMFKYILDALKKDSIKNPYGIIADDNPKIIHRIHCYSNKGEPKIGIKIKLCTDRKKDFFADDILKK